MINQHFDDTCRCLKRKKKQKLSYKITHFKIQGINQSIITICSTVNGQLIIPIFQIHFSTIIDQQLCNIPCTYFLSKWNSFYNNWMIDLIWINLPTRAAIWSGLSRSSFELTFAPFAINSFATFTVSGAHKLKNKMCKMYRYYDNKIFVYITMFSRFLQRSVPKFIPYIYIRTIINQKFCNIFRS